MSEVAGTGTLILFIMSFAGYLASSAALLAGLFVGALAPHWAWLPVAGALAVLILWFQRPALFEVLEGTALAVNIIPVFLAGLAWSFLVLSVCKRILPRKEEAK
jgi:hypothetical protein